MKTQSSSFNHSRHRHERFSLFNEWHHTEKNRPAATAKNTTTDSTFSFSVRGRNTSMLLMAVMFWLLRMTNAATVPVNKTHRQDIDLDIIYSTSCQFAVLLYLLQFCPINNNAKTPLHLVLPQKPWPSMLTDGTPLTFIKTEPNNCHEKTSGISAGKFCDIDGDRYLLKTITETASANEIISDANRAIYNFSLLNQLGIAVPSHQLVYEAANHYFAIDKNTAHVDYFLATKFNPTFKTGDHLKNLATKQTLRMTRGMKADTIDQTLYQQNFRQMVVDSIGEFGLCQLAVAGTLIQDLVYNEGNWGYDAKGLFIVDVDHSPSTLQEYYQEAYRMSTTIQFTFSLDTLQRMSHIYAAILTQASPFPSYEHSAISDEEFQQIIHHFQQACLETITQVTTSYPELQWHTPSVIVNQKTQDVFLSLLHEHLEQTRSPSP